MANGVTASAGGQLRATAIASAAVTFILFEVIGPILTKIALAMAREIHTDQ